MTEIKVINPGQDVGFAAAASGFLRSRGLDLSGHGPCVLFPGFCDVHVHFREPGFSYKETMASGSAAAARGGYTAVCAMPNLDPVPDSPEHLKVELDAIRNGAFIRVYPYGAITVGEKGETLSDLEGMADLVVAFSDDGHGVQDKNMMKEAMRRAKDLGRLIVAHCEDNSLLNGGYIHAGEYAETHGHRGISSESEYAQIARDLELAAETGCAYHVCHISTKESVALIRAAKARGVPVTCETAPHYLVLTEDDLREEGRFKMNPPLRSAGDREALVEGLLDGTIDAVATDHAPHTAAEKSRGLAGSAMGIVGLETAFPVLYTCLVLTGRVPLERLLDARAWAPRRIFGLPGALEEGAPADLAVIGLQTPFTLDSRDFASMGRATPFDGWTVRGRVERTLYRGETVFAMPER